MGKAPPEASEPEGVAACAEWLRAHGAVVDETESSGVCVVGSARFK